jgi:uncharacterized protein YbaP (TraB family)
MDEIKYFRNIMANNGIEHTPDEAKKIMDSISDFIFEIDKIDIQNPELFENFKNLTLFQKKQICQEMLESGQKITINELDELVALILAIRD